MSSGTDPGWPLEPWTVQVLGDLCKRGYTPAAWVRLLGASWRRARETARRERSLSRAWGHLSLAVLVGSAVPVALAWTHYGPRQARDLGGMLVAGLAGQQADAYLHLGLNRRLDDGVLLPNLGPALWLSYLRATAAWWLLAATRADLDFPGLAPGTVVVGALTDVLDGPLARRQGHATKLGAYADGEADIVLAVALTLAAVRRGTLPTSIFWLLSARYALPIGVAFGVAFTRGRSPCLAHTRAGQLCGVAQALLMACALAPRRWQQIADSPRHLFLPVTAIFSVASGLSHVWRVLRATAPGR